MKKWTILIAVAALLVAAAPVLAAKPTDKGFNEFGYNYQARNFVGTCKSWHMGKFGSDEAQAIAYCGEYANDKLVMKWSQAWDDAIFGPDGKRGSGDELAWTSDAWTMNEWNGMIPGGSGAVWHYKIAYDEGCATNGVPSTQGGYCIWGSFVTLMDQGIDPAYGTGHLWFAHAIPNGYGAY